MKTSTFEKIGWVACRGAILGVCHLTVYTKVMQFLDQPLDPFGTKSQNVDFIISKFIFNQKDEEGKIEMPKTDGDQLLAKLMTLGYF